MKTKATTTAQNSLLSTLTEGTAIIVNDDRFSNGENHVKATFMGLDVENNTLKLRIKGKFARLAPEKLVSLFDQPAQEEPKQEAKPEPTKANHVVEIEPEVEPEPNDLDAALLDKPKEVTLADAFEEMGKEPVAENTIATHPELPSSNGGSDSNNFYPVADFENISANGHEVKANVAAYDALSQEEIDGIDQLPIQEAEPVVKSVKLTKYEKAVLEIVLKQATSGANMQDLRKVIGPRMKNIYSALWTLLAKNLVFGTSLVFPTYKALKLDLANTKTGNTITKEPEDFSTLPVLKDIPGIVLKKENDKDSTKKEIIIQLWDLGYTNGQIRHLTGDAQSYISNQIKHEKERRENPQTAEGSTVNDLIGSFL